MIIDAIDALAGQRAALEAPADQQIAVFTAQVSEPLRPILGGLSRIMPSGLDPSTPEGLLAMARQLQVYMPEYGVERGLEALDTISRAGLWENCIAGLREAWRGVFASSRRSLTGLPVGRGKGSAHNRPYYRFISAMVTRVNDPARWRYFAAVMASIAQ